MGDPLHKEISSDYVGIPLPTTTAIVDKWAIAQTDTVLSQLAANSRGFLEQHLEMFLVSSPEAKGGAQVGDVFSLLHNRYSLSYGCGLRWGGDFEGSGRVCIARDGMTGRHGRQPTACVSRGRIHCCRWQFFRQLLC